MWRPRLHGRRPCLSRLSPEDRYRVLEYVVGKVGRDKFRRLWGISRITMWRLLNRQASLENGKFEILLGFISMQKIQGLLCSEKVLEILRVIESKEISCPKSYPSWRWFLEDEYLRQLIITLQLTALEVLRSCRGISTASYRI